MDWKTWWNGYMLPTLKVCGTIVGILISLFLVIAAIVVIAGSFPGLSIVFGILAIPTWLASWVFFLCEVCDL